MKRTARRSSSAVRRDLARAYVLDEKAQFRAAARVCRRICCDPAARVLLARLALRQGRPRLAHRRLRAVTEGAGGAVDLAASALRLLCDAVRGLRGGLAGPARRLAVVVTADRTMPLPIRARALGDLADTLWLCGRRQDAWTLVRQAHRRTPHVELAFRCANYAWALGRRREARRALAGAKHHTLAGMLRAEWEPRSARRILRGLCRAQPRGEWIDLARLRLALLDWRRDRDAVATAAALRELLRCHTRSPLRALVRRLLGRLRRRTERDDAGPAVWLHGFPTALQTADACVPTTLALAARWWGRPARLPQRGPKQGVVFADVPPRAHRVGLSAVPVPMTTAAFHACLTAGAPLLIAEQEAGEGHVVLVIGIDPVLDLVEVRDPAQLSSVEWPLADLRAAAWREGAVALALVPIGHPFAPPVGAAEPWETIQAARRHHADGQTDAALALLRPPHPTRPDLAAEMLLESARPGEAVRAARAWTRSAPGLAWSWYLLGGAAWLAGRPALAIRALRAAVRRAPTNALALVLLARVCAERGRNHEARKVLLRATDVEPANRDAHELLRRVAASLDDDRLVAEEREWLKGLGER